MNKKGFFKLNLFSLDEFLIPHIIRFIYILSFVVIVLYYLYSAFNSLKYSFISFFLNILFMLLGLLALRIGTELLYLWFAIYDALREIRDSVKSKGDKAEKNTEIIR